MPLNKFTALLRIHVHGATDLKTGPLGGKPDPYVKLVLDKNAASPDSRKTATISKTCNPVWNEDFFFVISDDFTRFVVVVMDKDTLSDDKLGYCSVLRKPPGERETTSRDKYFVEGGGFIEISTQEIPLGSSVKGMFDRRRGAIDEYIAGKNVSPFNLLEVTIHGAKDLPSSVFDAVDPYAKVEFAPSSQVVPSSLKTHVKEDSANPVWNETFHFLVPHGIFNFSLQVKDSNIGVDKEVGMCNIITKAGALVEKDRKALGKKGEITVSYWLAPLKPLFDELKETPPPEPVKAEVVEIKAPEPAPAPVPAPAPEVAPEPTFVPVSAPEPLPVSAPPAPEPEPVISVLSAAEALQAALCEALAEAAAPAVEEKETAKVLFDLSHLNGMGIVIGSKRTDLILQADDSKDSRVTQSIYTKQPKQKFVLRHISGTQNFKILSKSTGLYWRASGESLTLGPEASDQSDEFTLNLLKESNVYQFISASSGLFVDVSDKGRDEGLQLLPWNGGETQTFVIAFVNHPLRQVVAGLFALHADEGKTRNLDCWAGSHDHGAHVHLWEWADVANAKFRFVLNRDDGSFSLRAFHSKRFLGIRPEEPGLNASLIQWDHNPLSDHVRFFLKGNAVPGGWVTLESKTKGLVVGVRDEGTDNGTAIVLQYSNGKAHQRFAIRTFPQYFFHENVANLHWVHSGKSWDIAGGSTDDGAELNQYTPNYSPCQFYKFSLAGANELWIQPLHSGKYLTTIGGGTENGTKIHQQPRSDAAHFKWQICPVLPEGEYGGEGEPIEAEIVHVASGRCVEVPGGNKDNEVRAQLYDRVKVPHMIHLVKSFTSYHDQTFFIFSASVPLVLDVDGARTDNGTDVQLYDWHGGDNQKWILIQHPDDGSFSIRSVVSGKYLDIAGDSKDMGGKVHQWEAHFGNNQRFFLIPYPDGCVSFIAKSSGLALGCGSVSGGTGAGMKTPLTQDRFCEAGFQKFLFL